MQTKELTVLDAMPLDFPASWASGWGEDKAGLWMSFTYKGVRQNFRWIKPGEFLMGSPVEEKERREREGPQHMEILTKGFWLADTACTQALWKRVMGKNPSRFKGEDRPVEGVSWDDAQEFIAILNKEKPELCLRLPTEAEWEYACRAGTTTPFAFEGSIDPSKVNYNGDYPYDGGTKGVNRGQTVSVQSLPPNPWRLYEMHGNVLEWCDDWFGNYSEGSVSYPRSAQKGDVRVLRGGSRKNNGGNVRSAVRFRFCPDYHSDRIGFRLARGQNSSGS